LTPTRLRLFLGALMLALALPSAVLLWQTQQQLRWESLHQYRTLAEEMATRIDQTLQRLIAAEEARTESDYQFLVVAGDPNTSKMVQRSPLAQMPEAAQFPGLLGHFQIDADGVFSTPLLPDSVIDNAGFGLDDTELAQRTQKRRELFEVLSRNQLLAAREPSDKRLLEVVASASTQAAASASVSDDSATKNSVNEESQNGKREAEYQGQAAFDRLNSAPTEAVAQYSNQLGKVGDLKLSNAYVEAGKKDAQALEQKSAPPQKAQTRVARKEQSAVPEVLDQKLKVGDEETASAHSADPQQRVRIFESEVDPFEFGLLESGHGVLFRKVWRDGKRTIQGVLIDQAAFVDGVIAQTFKDSALWQMSDLVVAYQDQVLQLLPGNRAERSFSRAGEVTGELLYQTHLSAPLDRFQLLWTIKHLPAGPGARIVNWASLVLFAVLGSGFLAIYRLGLRQILLARQQQDFVSAVSHELKTPLTSIRMYAEMLREGWASEDKKRTYYEFIHDESERLSRLIANVLQLARMERNDLKLDLKPVRADTLLDMLRSKIHTQIERAGFTVDYALDPQCAARELKVDTDAFIQIMINLTDNAIKFSQNAAEHRIEIALAERAKMLVVSLRDYGPGVQKSQMKKIFQLFYRSGDELTRESLGTGIGLALVRQLARAMHGEVDVINRDPGAEFQLRLPVVG
jgi:signal transduction histidine kinase